MRNAGKWITIIVLASLWTSPVFAQDEPPEVPLRDQFSPVELTVITANIILGPAVLLGGPRVVNQQPTMLSGPREGTVDHELSEVLHGNLETGQRVFGGVADPMLLAAPWAAFLFYGTSAIWSAAADPWLGQRNIAHSFFAYAEALGWTSMLVGAARLLVRRDRPWVVLDRPKFERAGIEPTTSLLSSHTALGATFAAFVGLDLSAYLARRAGPGWRALPYPIVAGFVTAAATAHIADQENFLSDEIAAIVLGTTSGALAWFRHFDSSGQPRARRRVSVAPMLLPDGSVGLGLSVESPVDSEF